MATNKFLTVIGGAKRLVTAIFQSSGAGDAFKVISTNASGKLDTTFLPAGIGLQTESMITGEDLSAGEFINIYDNAGTRTARKADASNNRPAHGYVQDAVTSGQTATIYKTGSNPAVSGMTPGQIRYLSATTAGASTATAPSASGQILQVLGYADSSTSILFEFDEPTVID